jgi:hypothetical protein
MRRFTDDALLQALSLALTGLFAAWAYGLYKAWSETRDSRAETLLLRDKITALEQRIRELETLPGILAERKLRDFGDDSKRTA